MNRSGKSTKTNWRSQIALRTRSLLQSGLDPKEADPRLYRQVKILNGLMLVAMGLCIPLGLFWTQVVDVNFGYVYITAFTLWGLLFYWLQRSLRVVAVGRVAVLVLYALCTASVTLLGGTESNLLAWYMLIPLAAAVCVGRRDLWFWGFIAALTPAFIFFFPEHSSVATSPFSEAVNRQIAGTGLALGTMVVSILTGIWISHHERLAERLDDSVAQLKNEAEAQRLLVDIAMLASAETELRSGARKFLELLDQVPWVLAACYWDIRDSDPPIAPFHSIPQSAHFDSTSLLDRTIRTGKRSIAKQTESGRRNFYYPIQDGRKVVGVIEIDSDKLQDSTEDGSWLLQQIVIQLEHIAERERTAQIIQREARFDSLTGLHNRRAFIDILEREIGVAERESKKVALLFIDLNKFKRINDSLGHAAGDAVLKVVAKRLRQAVRLGEPHSDRADRAIDSISRVGGDEFTLVLNRITSAEDADLSAKRILESLSAPIQLHDQQFKIGASIGIAVFPDDAIRADALVRSADAAMYAAKRRGAVGYSRYRDSDKAVDSLSFEAEMRKALKGHQLEMHYQPVFNCQTCEVVGAEALIRWHHPERGWIPPDQFIPHAEHIGLISEIGRFQFDAVLQWFSAARPELPKDFRIALNLSPNQIEDSSFVDWLLNRLADSNLPMRNVELEITETALLSDTPEVEANVRTLFDRGLCITLDDFGTGQSSLSLLKRFPIGRIKIDRSFVSGLPDRSDDVAIVGAVLSLARSLEIPAVAEGVEKEAQKAFLALRECEYMQGYLLAKPMPGDELIQALRDSRFAIQASEFTQPMSEKIAM